MGSFTKLDAMHLTMASGAIQVSGSCTCTTWALKGDPAASIQIKAWAELSSLSGPPCFTRPHRSSDVGRLSAASPNTVP